MFFITDAFAAPDAAQAGGLVSFLPMIAFIAILYFLLIRPQQKRQKQHQALISSIKKGDKVVTTSGIIGTVSKVVSDHEVILEIANGVHCKFVKSAISSVMEDVQQNTAKPDFQGSNNMTEKVSQNSSKVVRLKTISKSKTQHKKPAPKKVAPKR